MTLTQLVIIIAVIVVIAVIALFPEARTLLKGFTRVFLKDMATTPEGAEAIYGEKIKEAEEAYAKADDAFKLAAGKVKNTTKDLERLNAQLNNIERECESLVKGGKFEMAQLKAEEREEVLSDIKRHKELLAGFSNAEKTAREAHDICERNLKKLKREQKEVVENMKVKKQLKEMYDDVDELKNVTATDRLLDSVREKNKDLDTIVEGSKVVHDNKLSTKIKRADDEAKKLQSNDYLESLKKKYNK